MSKDQQQAIQRFEPRIRTSASATHSNEDLARHLSELKNWLLAELSHDLRTPLNAIAGWAHIVSTNAENVAQVRKGAEVISRNARVQSELIDGLMQKNAMLKERAALSFEPIDLTELTARALDALPRSESGVVEAELEAQHPVRGDAAQLSTLVASILNAAVKSSTPGGPVKLASRDTARGLLVSVQWQCKGATEFKRIEQSLAWDGAADVSSSGLSLALAIASYIAKLHGGIATAKNLGENGDALIRVELPAD